MKKGKAWWWFVCQSRSLDELRLIVIFLNRLTKRSCWIIWWSQRFVCSGKTTLLFVFFVRSSFAFVVAFVNPISIKFKFNYQYEFRYFIFLKLNRVQRQRAGWRVVDNGPMFLVQSFPSLNSNQSFKIQCQLTPCVTISCLDALRCRTAHRHFATTFTIGNHCNFFKFIW